MEVTSINDIEEAQQKLQQDSILDSAVDQLEAFAQPGGMTSRLADIVLRFGQIKLDEERPLLRFEFDPPTTCKQWPGPRYSHTFLHMNLSRPKKPMPKSKVKSSKKHGQPEEWRQSNLPRKISKPKKVAKSDDRPSSLISVKSRDPPLHLLGIPAELRNVIWNELCLHSNPLDAQIRRVQPCKKAQRSKTKLLRRFPREPVVAMVSRQLRREVLSIFYGSNRFVFEKNSGTVFEGLSITEPTVMKKWMPSPSIAKFMSNITIRFAAATPLFPTMNDFAVAYELRRLLTGKTTVTVNARTPGGRISIARCICHELPVVTEMAATRDYTDLAAAALDLVNRRGRILFGARVAEVPPPEKLFPKQEKCEECGKDRFHAVDSGL